MLNLVLPLQSCTVKTARYITYQDRTPLRVSKEVWKQTLHHSPNTASEAYIAQSTWLTINKFKIPSKLCHSTPGMINLTLKEGNPHLPLPLAKKIQHKVGPVSQEVGRDAGSRWQGWQDGVRVKKAEVKTEMAQKTTEIPASRKRKEGIFLVPAYLRPLQEGATSSRHLRTCAQWRRTLHSLRITLRCPGIRSDIQGAEGHLPHKSQKHSADHQEVSVTKPGVTQVMKPYTTHNELPTEDRSGVASILAMVAKANPCFWGPSTNLPNQSIC